MSDRVSVDKAMTASSVEVWALVSDLPRMGEWSPENRGGTWVKGATGPVPGAKFKGDNAYGSKSWTTVATVLDADPGRRFSFLVNVGPLKIAEWAFDFEDTDTGCRVTESWTDRRNGIVRKLGSKASGVDHDDEHTRRGIGETLDRLAATAEAPAPT